jgi:hypothetical protein
MEKLISLKVSQQAKDWVIQPTGNGILIYLSGFILIEGESNPVNFIRVFNLANVNGSYYSKIILGLLIFHFFS